MYALAGLALGHRSACKQYGMVIAAVYSLSIKSSPLLLRVLIFDSLPSSGYLASRISITCLNPIVSGFGFSSLESLPSSSDALLSSPGSVPLSRMLATTNGLISARPRYKRPCKCAVFLKKVLLPTGFIFTPRLLPAPGPTPRVPRRVSQPASVEVARARPRGRRLRCASSGRVLSGR